MTLTDEQRGVFAAVADTLIPAGHGLPSATEVGVHTDLIDRVLGFRADLAGDFDAAVAACAGEAPESALDRLAQAHPEQFAVLTLLTAGAYILSDDVLAGLRYVAPPVPVVDDLDSYVDMLADVVERGFHIR
jgi:hypothetical protein